MDKNSQAQGKNRPGFMRGLLCVLMAFAVSSCAGRKIAPDLLAQTERANTPLVSNAVIVDAEINPAIHNYERIDVSVKKSLEMALRNANLFGSDSSRPYRISANVLVASESAWSFGSFNGKMKINYRVFDANNRQIMDETIYTEAGSDHWKFSGAARHQRARAVNISKNVLQFVDVLRKRRL